MSQQQKSTPKMRRAYTPRVKSAQNINNPQINRPLFFTDKKAPPNLEFNPQKVQHEIAKKLNINTNPGKMGKFDIALMQTDTDSPIKKNNYFSNPLQIKVPQTPAPKPKQLGRNIQWPANVMRGHMNHQNPQNREGKISRCMSAHTIKSAYSNKSEKTDRIKEHRKQFNEKFGVAFDYLITSNSQYLNEKLSMCNQKARPKEKNFSLKRPSINTTNKDFYKQNQDKHRLEIEPQNQKMSILMSESKVCGNSTTQQFHQGRHAKRAQLAQWPEGFKLQGPIYQVTTNSNTYPNHGEFEKMVPIAVWNEHPLGMKHRSQSTNSRLMKGQFAPRSDLATWNNLNPLANDLFNPKNGTHYGKQFCKKQKQPIQQWPMPEHKLIITDGKFSTQMKTNLVDFNQHELHLENKCNCGRKRH